MVDVLADNPVLLLFVVAAGGFLVGRVRVLGFSLGVAAVLFVGIAFGAVDARLQLPAFAQEFGLALFVYTIGLASGPGFVTTLRRRGLRANALVAGVLVLAAALVGAIAVLLDLGAGLGSGLFAGSLTNTPALAAVLDSAQHHGTSTSAPVVAYSVAYPFGVIGPLLVIASFQRGRRRRAAQRAVGGDGQLRAPVVARTVRVTRTGLPPIGDLVAEQGWSVVVSRVRHDGHVALATGDDVLRPSDLATVVGTKEAVREVVDWLGEPSDEHLAYDRRELDADSVFVSNPAVAGKPLAELHLVDRFGAVATRVRRGDVDLLARGDLVLELGDRVLVVAPRDHLAGVTALLGNSYRRLGEIDVLTFSIGVALGLLLGLVRVPVPGVGDVTLGAAGGPLVVGLLLGALGRTGRLVWQPSYGANITLRQVGAVLFLAGVGTRSGQAFATTLREGGAARLVAAGVLVTLLAAGLTAFAGLRLLHLPPDVVAGVVAGIQTQPAALAFASEDHRAEPDVASGYSSVYPVAMIAKIVLAQLLFVLLR